MKTRMEVLRLGEVKPNPYRDIENYKLDPDKIASLRASIGNTGFWPGVLVREANGSFELLFGHHRIEAARLELGDDYEHQFIVREDVPDHVALKMLADENADSWAMGPQHALLCVKQAKAYLDDVLAMGWEEAAMRIRIGDLQEWFGNEGGFATAAKDGAGIASIRAFLGGAFAKGHGVRDALAILNRPEVDPRIAGKFTNLSQARTFAELVNSDDGKLLGLNDPKTQGEVVDQLLNELKPQGNGVDPKRKGAPSRVPEGERLIAGMISHRIKASARKKRGEIDAFEVSAAAKLAAKYDGAKSRCYAARHSLEGLMKEIKDLPTEADPTALPEAVTFLEAMQSLQAALDRLGGEFADLMKSRKPTSTEPSLKEISHAEH